MTSAPLHQPQGSLPIRTTARRVRPRGRQRRVPTWDADEHAGFARAPLEVLVAHSAKLLAGREVAAAAVDEMHVLQPLAASCDRAADMASFQAEHVEGPLVEAFLGGEPILDREVAEARASWPTFAAVAAAVGYRMVHAVPLATGADVVGALVIADVEVRPLDAGSLAPILALAEESAVAVLQELAHHHWEERAAQLQRALDSRVLVEQAKGALSERLGTTQQAAFEMLRTYARSHNKPIDDVASAVLAGPATIAV